MQRGDTPMPDHSHEPSRSDTKQGWWTLASTAVLAVVGGYAIAEIVDGDRGGSVIIGPTGIEFVVPERESLEDLITRITVEYADSAEALLANEGYYKLTSVEWVEQLRILELGAEVDRRIRQLLYDLDGPFDPEEEALAGSDERLMEAVLALHEHATEIDPSADEVANAFLARILVDNLEHQGVFKHRSYKAEIAFIAGPDGLDQGRHVVYACPGSVFEGKQATVRSAEKNRIIPASVVVDPNRFSNCPSPRTMRELLANKSERLGFTKLAFSELHGPVDSDGTLPPRMAAEMQVLPRHYTAVEREFASN
jgi:hypothetical protein